MEQSKAMTSLDRAPLRARRQRLSAEAQARASAACRQHLQTLTGWAGFRLVGAYAAFDGELDPSGFQAPGQRWFLPVLSGNSLLFRPDEGASLPNKFGIMEPITAQASHAITDSEADTPGDADLDVWTEHSGKQPSAPGAISPSSLDLLLVPGVAFGLNGHRLGMGAGYYDRALSFMLKPHSDPKPLLVGICHDFQLFESVPPQPWDVPVHFVCTPTALYPCSDFVDG